MVTREDNDLLTRVIGDWPMGQTMRRHWLPACMSEEVAEPDGAPVRTRMLGEDLVIFRDTKGRIGLLGEHCLHRRASLAFGRNAECGLRCLYHGWKFDVEGNILDQTCEPDGGRLKLDRKQKSYPARESGGIVWAYMGPKEEFRELDPPAWSAAPASRIAIVKMHVACNWAQVLEGSIDSAHSSSLHSTVMPSADVDGAKAVGQYWPRPSTDAAPRMQFQATPFGFRYAAIRKPIKNTSTHDYVRVTLFVAPFTVIIPPNDQYKMAQMLFPIDDENTMFYWVAFHETKGIPQSEWRKFCAAEVGVDLDSNYRKIRTLENRFLQDRDAMKRGDFTGIKGIPAQDMAMWESMGAITDRSQDNLGASDIAVIQFRRQMIAAARRFRDGGPAFGATEPRIPQARLASFEGIVPKSTDWRTLGVSNEERALMSQASTPAA
jgi:phthalate 4,5-dioxygenase oxygenase subunit